MIHSGHANSCLPIAILDRLITQKGSNHVKAQHCDSCVLHINPPVIQHPSLQGAQAELALLTILNHDQPMMFPVIVGCLSPFFFAQVQN